MNIHKILCPIDFSSSSDAALHYAAALCKTYGARLIILHVEEPPPTYVVGYPGVVQVPAGEPENDPRLDKTEPGVSGVSFERVRVAGIPADEIMELANQRGCDLIVMGTHAYSGLTKLLMGSVAESVMRRAEQPVLVVKHEAAAEEDTERSASVAIDAGMA